MANAETQKVDSILSSRRAMLVLGGTALAGLAFAGKAQAQSTINDSDILNFALNLEYLEAQYYTLATTGKTIDQVGIGITSGSGAAGGSVTVKSNPMVPFVSTVIAGYAAETAGEEQKHVSFLRSALGMSAVAMPNIDLLNSFAALGTLIGVPGFDPFASDLNFLLGSYIFEDVGVTAYHGAAALLTTPAYLDAAAGIMAVEAYHAGLVRTVLYGMDAANPSAGINGLATKISGVRATLDGTAASTPDDVGLGTVSVALNGSSANQTAATVVNADANALAFARTTTQVLAIVYASPSGTPGGFFPAGLNGTIK